LKILLGAAVLVLLCGVSQPSIAQPSGPQQPSAVQFKPDSADTTGSLALRVAGGLAVAAVLACGVIYGLKRFAPWISVPGAQAGKGGVRVLEALRVTQKLTLFVIEFGADRILLAHTDQGVTVVSGGSPGDAPRRRSEAP
jgi:flagellar biogenesis protein FliO